jgi:adenosylhomocysteine nucleosidase
MVFSGNLNMAMKIFRVECFEFFTFALQSESAYYFDDVATLYTGVGKVNAALVLGQYLATVQARGDMPSLDINCGTVGALTMTPGTVVQTRQFIQRDMDVTALRFPASQTSFDEMSPILTNPSHPRSHAIPTQPLKSNFLVAASECVPSTFRYQH